MVHFVATSIFLLPIVTILGSEFWNDVDKKFYELLHAENLSTQATVNDLSGPKDIPAQGLTGETQQEGPSSGCPRSNNEVHISTPPRRMNPKQISFHRDEMVPFMQAIVIDESYPKNLTESVIIDKLIKLRNFHEWPLLRLYDVEDYTKYWAYVCTFFAEVNLTSVPRVSCRLTPTFDMANQRHFLYDGITQFFDLLGCHCYGYQGSYYFPATPRENFLIHQSGANEFFLFKQEKFSKRIRLAIKAFRGGVTLPNPSDFINFN